MTIEQFISNMAEKYLQKNGLGFNDEENMLEDYRAGASAMIEVMLECFKWASTNGYIYIPESNSWLTSKDNSLEEISDKELLETYLETPKTQ